MWQSINGLSKGYQRV